MLTSPLGSYSVVSLTVYSHSCGVTGQLFVQQHSKLSQWPDPAGENCFLAFWFWGWLVCFKKKNQPHIYISTWHDTNMWGTTVEDWASWEGTAILIDPNGNRAWNPWMPEFCFPSLLVARFCFFLCIGICLITKWANAFLTRSLLSHFFPCPSLPGCISTGTGHSWG